MKTPRHKFLGDFFPYVLPAAGTDEPESSEGEEVLRDLDSNQDTRFQKP